MDLGVRKDREVFKEKMEFKAAIEISVANISGFSYSVVLFNWHSQSNSKIGARY